MSSSSPQTLPSAALALFPHALLQHSKKQRVVQKKILLIFSMRREKRGKREFHLPPHLLCWAHISSRGAGLVQKCSSMASSIHPLHEGPCFPVQPSYVGSAALGTSWYIAEDLRASFSSLSSSHTCTQNIVRHCSPSPFPSCCLIVGET